MISRISDIVAGHDKVANLMTGAAALKITSACVYALYLLKTTTVTAYPDYLVTSLNPSQKQSPPAPYPSPPYSHSHFQFLHLTIPPLRLRLGLALHHHRA